MLFWKQYYKRYLIYLRYFLFLTYYLQTVFISLPAGQSHWDFTPFPSLLSSTLTSYCMFYIVSYNRVESITNRIKITKCQNFTMQNTKWRLSLTTELATLATLKFDKSFNRLTSFVRDVIHFFFVHLLYEAAHCVRTVFTEIITVKTAVIILKIVI